LDALGLMLDALDATGAATPPPDLTALRRQLRQLVPAAGAAGPAPATAVRMAPAAAWTPQPPAPRSTAQPPASAQAQAELPQPHPAPAAASPEDTVRVSLASLEQQLLGAEELLVSKLVTRERANSMREVSAWFMQWRRAWSAMERSTVALRHDVASPEVQRLHDFCEWSNDAVRTLEGRIMELRRATQRDRETIGKLADSLLEGAKDLLLVPFSSISGPLPRMVRDLARAQGKEVDLLVSGEQTQVDKHILEEMKDTLVQMLRNAVDHAVELPAARVAAGKPARATVQLSIARREGRRVHIELSDDGRGIDVQAVRRAALERGVITPEHAAALDDEGALALVFRSDVSTGTAATPLSGRGLGLAIAHEHVRRLEGQLRVRSTPGTGTRFEIELPAVRATFRGILCEAAGQVFMLPVHAVGRVGRV
ncbi:MAG: hybrid sensor histidine kinase/response regulator, partial [Variovorax sp.]